MVKDPDRQFPQSGSDGRVDVTFDGDVAIVHMMCGENRLNDIFFSKLHAALDQVERNPDCKVLVTVSSGKIYSNGIDLEWVVSSLTSDPVAQAKFSTAFNSMTARILTFPMVTVAAVNGHAFAGGAILALSHDYMVMRSDRGFWCLNEVSIGLRMPRCPLELIRAKLPSPAVITQALIHGKRFTAAEAVSAGFCSRASTEQSLINDAKEVGQQALGQTGFDRDLLQTMKTDLYESVLCHRVFKPDQHFGISSKL